MLEKQQTPLAKFVEENANRSGYSHEEIGIMRSIKTADPVYAFMCGEIRLPLDKVAPMALGAGLRQRPGLYPGAEGMVLAADL